jgi:hypothetical protein
MGARLRPEGAVEADDEAGGVSGVPSIAVVLLILCARRLLLLIVVVVLEQPTSLAVLASAAAVENIHRTLGFFGSRELDQSEGERARKRGEREEEWERIRERSAINS